MLTKFLHLFVFLYICFNSLMIFAQAQKIEVTFDHHDSAQDIDARLRSVLEGNPNAAIVVIDKSETADSSKKIFDSKYFDKVSEYHRTRVSNDQVLVSLQKALSGKEVSMKLINMSKIYDDPRTVDAAKNLLNKAQASKIFSLNIKIPETPKDLCQSSFS